MTYRDWTEADQAALQAKACEIAQALATHDEQSGETWTVIRGAQSFAINLLAPKGEDLAINIYVDYWRAGGRWIITGYQPSTKMSLARGYSDRIEITVAPDRTADAVAREIARRLLPDLRAALAHLLSQQSNARAYEDRCQAVRAQLVAALGGEGMRKDMYPYPVGTFYEPEKRNSESGHTIFVTASKTGRADFEYSDDRATVKLQWIPVDLAVRVAALIREYAAETA